MKAAVECPREFAQPHPRTFQRPSPPRRASPLHPMCYSPLHPGPGRSFILFYSNFQLKKSNKHL